ncbi:hypothetical protein RKE29_19495, partial [Streptomyces sp. B1866]|nr:hypothetical protein [Streptomyces sp. B1866]
PARPAGPPTLPVRAAVLGLAAHQVAGRPALVPSWLFTVGPQGAKDGVDGPSGAAATTVTYPAVDPAFLTSASPGRSPGRGGDGPAEGRTPSRSPGTVPDVPAWLSYRAAGRSLTVRFPGGVCSDYAVVAKESASRVEVGIRETGREGRVCVLMAVDVEKTVTLDKPLGGRTVVDAKTGQPVPAAPRGR